MDNRGKQISDWLRTRVLAAGARGLVVGLSGGIDSAVVARLCQMAMPGQVLGAMMPCQSDPGDEADAALVASHFAIPAVRLDLQPAFEQLIGSLRETLATIPSEQRPQLAEEEIERRTRVPLGNIKPRLRMTALYFLANSLNYLVAGTANRSEISIGCFTKYGDGGVDLLPLGTMLKAEVRLLAVDLGVPRSIIEKPPSAGLWAGQTDEGDMGFSYAELERYLVRGPDGVAPALALRLERMIRSTEHKRQLPPVPE